MGYTLVRVTTALAIGWAGPIAALLLVIGLFVRRRASGCWAFVAYLGVVAGADLLQLLWPDRFFRQSFWLSKELVIAALRFAIALELTYRTFRAFPGARATARSVLLLLLVLTLAAVTLGTSDLPQSASEPQLGALISRLQPRLLNGTIWLLTAIAALILWYRVPVQRLHKAILSGLVPYLLVFTTSLNLIESWGWEVRSQASYLHTIAYLALLSYWTVEAWRKGDLPVQAPAPTAAVQRSTG